MDEEIYGLITFKSTHHTIQGEGFLEDRGLEFKTIPTPREISKSCGLSILFQLDDLYIVEDIVSQATIKIDSVYKYTKRIKDSRAEKII